MVALHDTVAVPDPLMLVGLIVPHVRPEGTRSVRLTVPAKRFRLVIGIVDTTDEPALAGAGEVAAIVKSRNWKVAVVLWTSCVLVPMIVAV